MPRPDDTEWNKPRPRTPAPRVDPVLLWPTPERRDLLFFVERNGDLPQNQHWSFGDPFEDRIRYPDHKLVHVSPQTVDKWSRWYFASDRINENEYNYEVGRIQVGTLLVPSIKRTYITPRSTFKPTEAELGSPMPDAPEGKFEQGYILYQVNQVRTDKELDSLFVQEERIYILPITGVSRSAEDQEYVTVESHVEEGSAPDESFGVIESSVRAIGNGKAVKTTKIAIIDFDEETNTYSTGFSDLLGNVLDPRYGIPIELERTRVDPETPIGTNPSEADGVVVAISREPESTRQSRQELRRYVLPADQVWYGSRRAPSLPRVLDHIEVIDSAENPTLVPIFRPAYDGVLPARWTRKFTFGPPVLDFNGRVYRPEEFVFVTEYERVSENNSVSSGESTNQSSNTSVSSNTGTSISSNTGTSISTNTGTSVSTNDGTSTSTVSGTSSSTNTGTSTSTTTSTGTSTNSGTASSTNTGTSTSTATGTSTSTNSGTASSTNTGTSESSTSGTSTSESIALSNSSTTTSDSGLPLASDPTINRASGQDSSNSGTSSATSSGTSTSTNSGTSESTNSGTSSSTSSGTSSSTNSGTSESTNSGTSSSTSSGTSSSTNSGTSESSSSGTSASANSGTSSSTNSGTSESSSSGTSESTNSGTSESSSTSTFSSETTTTSTGKSVLSLQIPACLRDTISVEIPILGVNFNIPATTPVTVEDGQWVIEDIASNHWQDGIWVTEIVEVYLGELTP